MNREPLTSQIVRHFSWEHDPALGHDGLRPHWMPNGTPTLTNEIAAHDVLEHVVDSIGGAEGELMARGMQIWGRGQSGWYNKEDRAGFPCWPGFLAVDISWIIVNILNKKETCNPYPFAHYAVEGSLHADILWLLEAALQAAACELKMPPWLLDANLPPAWREHMKDYMLKGFVEGSTYYTTYGFTPRTFSDFFDDLVDALNASCNGTCMKQGNTVLVDVNLIDKEICVLVNRYGDHRG